MGKIIKVCFTLHTFITIITLTADKPYYTEMNLNSF